jgi:hypothetical protein
VTGIAGLMALPNRDGDGSVPGKRDVGLASAGSTLFNVDRGK